MLEAHARRLFSTVTRLQVRHVHPVRHHVKKRYFDDATLAGTFARKKTLHNRLIRCHARSNIANGDTDTCCNFFCATDHAQSAFGLDQKIIRLLISIRPVFTVTRNRHIDQARVAVRKLIRTKPEACRSTRCQILDKHISFRYHICENRMIFWLFDV